MAQSTVKSTGLRTDAKRQGQNKGLYSLLIKSIPLLLHTAMLDNASLPVAHSLSLNGIARRYPFRAGQRHPERYNFKILPS